MARKEQDPGKDDADDKGPKGKAGDEDDGYRRTRREEVRGAIGPGGKDDAPDKDKARPRPQLTAYQAFMEAHWESWLSQVLMLGAVAVVGLGYMWDIWPESFVALCLVATVVIAAVYTTAWPSAEMIQGKLWRNLFGALVVLWAVSAGYPPLRKIKPRQVLGEGVVTEVNKPVKVALQGGTGPFDVTVSGKLAAEGQQNAEAAYVLSVAAGGETDTIEGKLEYVVGQTRMRRGGTSHWTQRHDQKSYPVSMRVRGSEVTLTALEMDSLFKDGLHVRVHPYDPLLRVLLPFRIGDVEVPVVGLLVFLIMILVEARIGDAKTKTYLAMAAAVTMVFSTDYHMQATSVNLVRPGIGALFNALIFGGMGGTFVGWLARKLGGRDKVKPPRSTEGKKGESED